MKTTKLACLIISLVVMAFLAGNSMAGDLSGKKVVVVSGVAKARAEETNYNKIIDGITQGFKPAGITPISQFAEMTYQTTDEGKTKAGDVAIANARAEKPDVIIVLDDDALKYVGARIDDIPIVFSYTFGAPNALGMPKDNVTGIIRVSYAADIWRLTKKLFPTVKTVGLISKYSLPMEGVKRVLTARAPYLEKDCGVLFKDMILCETFEDWEKAVNTFPYDFIYLADTSRIVKDGKEMTREEVTIWTVANAKVPVIAATEPDTQAGALFSIVTSEKAMGTMAAESALEILSGAPPDQVYKQSKKGKLVFNAKTIQKYKIEVPYDILSTAEKVYE